ncbi:MAG: glycosyltransferase family 4 protein, partial [Flavobacteriaceae bacterium]|nr:glycosyltransferase family 4 protein [Flavobacteriaceae bacterium]
MKPKLLYFYPKKATFVAKDISILEADYSVKTQDLKWTRKSLLLLNFISQFFFILRNLKNTPVFIVMFGGYWSFLPALFGKLFHKKVFVILGGTDCVSFPEFNYGSLRKQPLKWFIKKSYQWCSKLLPVADSLIFSDCNYLPETKYKKQGIKTFFKHLKTPYTVIPNGFDSQFWDVKEAVKTPKSFLSIAFVNDRTRLTLKGFDTVIKLAQHFKEASFTLVGLDKNLANELEIPNNVKIYGFLDPIALKREIAVHQFYLQLSLSEGFPNALAEAMLGQCIPIGTAVGGIPKIINKTGVVLEQQEESVLQNEIKKLLALSDAELQAMGQSARAQIASNFSLEKRAELLSLALTAD